MPLQFTSLRELAQAAVETGLALSSESVTPEITPQRARSFFLAMEAALPTLADAPVAEAAKMKTIGGVRYPASDFLVVEEPQAASTWHLQVKKNGKPDHQLMGAAHAALLSPQGFRGKKYAGPNKRQAIAALKQLYAEEEMEWPVAESARLAEFDGSLQDYCRRVERAFLDAFPTQYDQTGRSVSYYCSTKIFNKDSDMGSSVIVIEYPGDVMYRVGYEETPDSGFTFTDRGEWERVAPTYKVLGVEQPAEDETPAQPTTSPTTYEGETMEAAFSEDAHLSGLVDAVVDVTAIADLAEAAIEMTGPRSPVSVEMTIVRAGPGNKRDGRYYTPAGLSASAGAFTGAPMFLTDHDPNALGEGTKVGVITRDWWNEAAQEIRGTAIIYDPNLAEKTRCRASADQLNTMEVSIYGNGNVRRGQVSGESYDLVERILPGARVDFVSAAGAGGKVISLAESANGGGEGKTEEQVAEVTPPTVMGQEAVLEILAETALPPKSVTRLVSGQYTDEAVLREAIRGETERAVRETSSGNPTGGFTAQKQTTVSLEEARDRSGRVLAEHGFRPAR